jgi:hypothetical protein
MDDETGFLSIDLVDHPLFSDILHSLPQSVHVTILIAAGDVLRNRWNTKFQPHDLDRSISMYKHAIIINDEFIAGTAQDHPARAGRLNNLGLTLLRRFNWT